MARSVGIVDCDIHIVAATWKKLDEDDQGFSVLTFRLQIGAATAIEWGTLDENGNIKVGPFLKAEESWTLGPAAGTVHLNEVYIKGTAGDHVSWGGIKV